MNIPFNKKAAGTNHILSGSSLWNFIKLLHHNKFAIDREFLPKIFKSFSIILLSVPNYLIEHLLFDSHIKRTKIRAPIFILGYPRSGTTNLMYLLSRDSRFAFSKTYQCIAPHIMFTFGKVIRFIAKRALPKTRPMDNMPLGADLPKEEEFAMANLGLESMAHAYYFPKKFMEYLNRFVLFAGNSQDKENWKRNHRYFLQKIALKNRGKQLLLKSPFDTGRVKELLELYPDACFIHIYRNPYTVYSSNEKLFEGILPQLSFQRVGNDEMKRNIFSSYQNTYKKYFNDKSLIPSGRLLEFAYEDFIGNENYHLQKIYAQFNLGQFENSRDLIQAFLEKQKGYTTNKYSLSADEEAEVFSEWKFAFEKFGYAMQLKSNTK